MCDLSQNGTHALDSYIADHGNKADLGEREAQCRDHRVHPFPCALHSFPQPWSQVRERECEVKLGTLIRIVASREFPSGSLGVPASLCSESDGVRAIVQDRGLFPTRAADGSCKSQTQVRFT